MDTKGAEVTGVGGGGVLNWAIGIDIYTLMCIKLMTNKDLLCKKINKIKFKRKPDKVNCSKILIITESRGWVLVSTFVYV